MSLPHHRRRQAGFTAGLLAYLIAAAAVLAALYGLIHFIDRTWATSAGVKRGDAEARAEFARRDNEALRAAIAAREAAEKRVRQIEDANAAAVTAAANDYQRRLADARALHDRFVAGVRSGAIRLRDPGHAAGPADCARDATGAAGAGPGGRDGAPGRVLSDEAGLFLWAEAGRADSLRDQLLACQRIVAADRRQ